MALAGTEDMARLPCWQPAPDTMALDAELQADWSMHCLPNCRRYADALLTYTTLKSS